MKDTCFGTVTKYKVKRRTFEGKINPEKNAEALTSEYQPSYRYIAFYTVKSDNSTYDCNRCFRTKREALETMEDMSKGFQIW